MAICDQNNNKGIGSILGFDQFDERLPRTNTCSNSLRRTLSADMSSRNWLTQNGFSPLKKIASSKELQIEVISEEDQKKETDFQEEQPGQFDIWCSIISQKSSSSSLPSPYVHPLVKRSQRCLTEKSLEICTENLGSESGSDGFSSYSPSEISCDEEEQERDHVEKEEMGMVNYNCSVSRKSLSSSSAPRSFPPPLLTLSRAGEVVHMKSHRQDGRLVLEAVSVPATQNYFHAQRQDGRLLLTFINPSQQSTQLLEEEEEIENDNEEFVLSDEEDEEEETEVLLEAIEVPKLPSGMINVHRSALMVNKFMGLTRNINPIWSDHQTKFEKLVHDYGEDYYVQEKNSTKLLSPSPQPAVISRLLRQPLAPPQPSVASSFNTYNYCWRKSSTMESINGIYHPLINNQHQQSLSKTQKSCYNYNNNQNDNNFLGIKDSLTKSSSRTRTTKRVDEHQNSGGEKIDHLVTYLRSCKKPKRSLLFWEPYCIAT